MYVSARFPVCKAVVYAFAAASAVCGTSASAQETLKGGCLLAPAKFSDTLISAFVESPADLIERHPLGGVAMSAEVKRLAASDVATVVPMLTLAKTASSAQVVAMGAGLAQAGGLCAQFRIEVQTYIEKAVAQANLPALTAAFAVYKFSPTTAETTPIKEVVERAHIGTAGNAAGAKGAAATAPPPSPAPPAAPSTTTGSTAVPMGQTEDTSATREIGPFATSENAMSFFTGRGGIGGGAPPLSDSQLRLQLGEFSFSQTALPFFSSDRGAGVTPGSGGGGIVPGPGIAGSPSTGNPSTVFTGGGAVVTGPTRDVVSPTN